MNNAFVERWQEFDEQPDWAADPVWLAGFDADFNALYIIDSKWYYVEPGMVLNDKLWFYALYAEASFTQMEVLEEIREQVHDIAAGRKAMMLLLRLKRICRQDLMRRSCSRKRRE